MRSICLLKRFGSMTPTAVLGNIYMMLMCYSPVLFTVFNSGVILPLYTSFVRTKFEYSIGIHI